MKLIDLFGSNQATKQSEFGSASTPTISGNTGIESVDTALDWIGRGADVYRDVKGASTVVPPNTPSQTTPGTKPATIANATWLPYALIGAVLVGAFLIFRR